MGHLYIHHSDSLLRQQKLHQKIQMARGCQNTIPIAYTRCFWQRFPWGGGFFGDGFFSWDNKKPQLYLHITKRLVGPSSRLDAIQWNGSLPRTGEVTEVGFHPAVAAVNGSLVEATQKKQRYFFNMIPKIRKATSNW